jgi:guanylate kinase
MAVDTVVVCGPSGVGKGTLISKLLADSPSAFGFSVSVTTRGPRPGEVDGTHYHFLSRDQAQARVDESGMVEFAEVHGTLYGTPKSSIDAVTATGAVCILDIDVQGAEQVKRSGIRALYLFIAPPSFEALEARLRGRGTETEDKVLKRLAGAKAEMARSEEPGFFDAVIVNDVLEDAYAAFRSCLADALPLALSAEMAKRGLSELASTTDGAGMALVTLDASRASVVDVSVLRSLPQLRNLCLSHNRLTSLEALSCLRQLCRLDVSHNRLSGLNALTGLSPTLASLDASHNSITGLTGVGLLPSLSQLRLSSNRLTGEGVGEELLGLLFLSELDMSHNQLSGAAPLPLPPTLRELSVCGNQLTQLHFVHPMAALLVLSASANRLIDTQGLAGFRALLHADLSSNCIRSLDALRPLSLLTGLGGLRLDANPLSEAPGYRHDVLAALQQLQALDLQLAAPEEKVRAINAHGVADAEIAQIRMRHFPPEAAA